jgi:hypothetical protein
LVDTVTQQLVGVQWGTVDLEGLLDEVIADAGEILSAL